MKPFLFRFLRPFLSIIVGAAVMATALAEKEPGYFDPIASHSQLSGKYNLMLQFRPVADSLPLIFGKVYSNPFQEPYTVRKFKFYVHAISVGRREGHKEQLMDRDSIHLIDFADTDRLATVKLAVPSGTYDRISFIVGVDSIFNVSGAQTGALDPLHGMFWTWNTGYIVAKLEGNSPVAKTLNNAFAYHIGGFKGPNNVTKRITLHFSPAQMPVIKNGDSCTLTVTANANAWFGKPHQIHLNATPTCMTPGVLSKQIADNYSNMFTVTNIVNTP